MALEPGSTLGAYRIIERAGKGGMATVYKAYQPALDRHVAIKVLPETLAEDEAFRSRFEQEAKTVARLRHPSIVAVHDFGTQGGLAYIVTELVEGGTLADRLGTPMPLEEVVRLLAPIASALDYAHKRGVLHRDVKPSNILLTADGAPVLSDFGLAKMLEADNQLTKASAVIGTPQYMAPEQCEGAPAAPSADEYSLAVVAYEMLTGRPPFQAETPAAVILAQIQGTLPPPRQLNPALSQAVEAVLLKGLARDPADRYPTCSEFTAAIQNAGMDQPASAGTGVPVTPAKPASAGTRVRRGLPAPVWVGGLAALLAVAVVAGGTVLYMQPKPGAAHSPAPPAVSSSPAAPSPSPKPAQEAEQPLPDSRQEAAAAAVIDHLYVVGGLAADNHSLDSILVYVDGTWGPGPRLPLGLDHTAAANLDGQLYIAGGYNNGTASARAFRLNGSSWQELAALRHPRGALALLPFDGHLYAIGGESGGTQVAPVEQYDPVSNGWTDLPVLPLPRNHVAGFVYQGKLCAAGGRPNDTARVDCYDPASRSWSQLPALPRATSGGGAGTLGDEVVVAGGEDTVHSILVDQVFRFSGGAWRSEPMLVPRHGAALALLDGRLWACGGGAAVGLKPVNTCTSIG